MSEGSPPRIQRQPAPRNRIDSPMSFVVSGLVLSFVAAVLLRLTVDPDRYLGVGWYLGTSAAVVGAILIMIGSVAYGVSIGKSHYDRLSRHSDRAQ